MKSTGGTGDHWSTLVFLELRFVVGQKSLVAVVPVEDDVVSVGYEPLAARKVRVGVVRVHPALL